MIQSGDQKERHTLPRWSSLNTAKKLGEMSPTKTKVLSSSSADDQALAKLLDEWKQEKSLPLAVDIISAANLSMCDEDISEVRTYAQNAVEEIKESNPLLKELLFGSETSTICDTDTHQVCIEKIKKSLIDRSRNPLLWSELSREYTIMGQAQKSERAIQIAYNLAPENRTVLRAIARFYEHNGDVEKALYYLRKSNLLKNDPWIASSEIALSNEMGRTSKNVKWAQKMVLDKNFHPLAISELASELGTMDFLSGSSKQGKKKLELATQVPHENAIAQIAWINQNAYNVSSIISSIPDTNCNFEAEMRLYYSAQDWENALELAGLWQEYQPFSREPAMVSSFIATDFLMDYQRAETTLRCGLNSNPTDYQLLNNYVYVLALNGQIDKANDAILRAEKYSPEDYIPLIATAGLLNYRQGREDLGKTLYLQAIDKAKQQNSIDLVYRATLCLAREEKRCGRSIDNILSAIDGSKYAPCRRQYERIINNFGLGSE